MVNRLVCVVANLKPAKLAGEASEAMVLAAEAVGADGKLRVYTLIPPEGSQPGDLIHLDGSIPPDSYPKVLKPDVWRKVVPGLTVQGGKVGAGGTVQQGSRAVCGQKIYCKAEGAAPLHLSAACAGFIQASCIAHLTQLAI